MLVLLLGGGALAFAGVLDSSSDEETADGANDPAGPSTESADEPDDDEPSTFDAGQFSADEVNGVDGPFYISVDILDGDPSAGSGHAELETLTRPGVPTAGGVLLSELTVGTCWFFTDDLSEYATVPCSGEFVGITFDVFESDVADFTRAPDLALDDCITTFAEQGLPGIDVSIEALGPSEIQWLEGRRTVHCFALPLQERT